MGLLRNVIQALRIRWPFLPGGTPLPPGRLHNSSLPRIPSKLHHHSLNSLLYLRPDRRATFWFQRLIISSSSRAWNGHGHEKGTLSTPLVKAPKIPAFMETNSSVISDIIAEAETSIMSRKPITTATSFASFKLGRLLGVGTAAAVYSAVSTADPTERVGQSGRSTESACDTIALKVMFNYSLRSDSDSFLRTVKMEMLPAEHSRLGGHPNIVQMGEPFVDRVQPSLLPAAHTQFPAVVELGRSTTCILPMRRYGYTLAEYLTERGRAMGTGERVSLYKQLVEGVAWLERNGVSHRDLKTNNLLIEEKDNDVPRLVIADFGFAIDSLELPHSSEYISRGGNRVTMAPEIVYARPGPAAVLDYSKADAWSVGSLAYEIFGCPELFVAPDEWDISPQESVFYLGKKQLIPSIPALQGEWSWVQWIVRGLLQADPSVRLSCRQVATLMHMHSLCTAEHVSHPFELTMSGTLQRLWTSVWTSVYVCTRLLQREAWRMDHWCSLLLLQRESLTSVRTAAYHLGMLCDMKTSLSAADWGC